MHLPHHIHSWLIILQTEPRNSHEDCRTEGQNDVGIIARPGELLMHRYRERSDLCHQSLVIDGSLGVVSAHEHMLGSCRV